MALTVNISKILPADAEGNIPKTINKSWEKMFSITLNMILLDGAMEALNQNFTEVYKTGWDISKVEDRFIEQMQSAIDGYKQEQQIYTHPNLDTGITNIQAGLEV